MDINLQTILENHLTVPVSSADQKKLNKILQWGDDHFQKERIFTELKSSVAKTEGIVLDKFRADAESLLGNLNSSDKKMCLDKLDEAIMIEEVRRKGMDSKEIKKITQQITAKKLKDNPRAARIFNDIIKKLFTELNPICLLPRDSKKGKPPNKDLAFIIIADILNDMYALDFTFRQVKGRYYKHE